MLKKHLFVLFLVVLVGSLFLTACDENAEAEAVVETVDEASDQCIGCEGGVCPAPIPDEGEAMVETVDEASDQCIGCEGGVCPAPIPAEDDTK